MRYDEARMRRMTSNLDANLGTRKHWWGSLTGGAKTEYCQLDIRVSFEKWYWKGKAFFKV